LSILTNKLKKVFRFKWFRIALLGFLCFITPFISAKYSPALILDPREVVIDDRLLDAIIQIESSNNPKAHNRFTGARGLTQITPIAWRDLRRHHADKYNKLNYLRDIFKPAVAREAGKDYLQILATYLKAKGMPITYHNLLTAYVWGPDNLYKLGIKKLPKNGRNYVAKVMGLLDA